MPYVPPAISDNNPGTPASAAFVLSLLQNAYDQAVATVAATAIKRTVLNMAGQQLVQSFWLTQARFDTIREDTLGAAQQASGSALPTGTCTTTSGSPNLTVVTPTTGWKSGMAITGAGIPASTFIKTGDGTATMTMSANANNSASSVAIAGDDLMSTLTIPSAGYYMWNIQPTWTPQNDTDNRAWHLQLNPLGNRTNGVVVAASADVALWNGTIVGSWQGTLAATDVLQLMVYHENGSAVNWGGANRPLASAGQSTNCEMMLCKLGV